MSAVNSMAQPFACHANALYLLRGQALRSRVASSLSSATAHQPPLHQRASPPINLSRCNRDHIMLTIPALFLCRIASRVSRISSQLVFHFGIILAIQWQTQRQHDPQRPQICLTSLPISWGRECTHLHCTETSGIRDRRNIWVLLRCGVYAFKDSMYTSHLLDGARPSLLLAQ